ncbi:hypothetical protein [Streptomyces spectabilis]|uniref:Uncharacterized protein n=1 Tax=Streptomyces spectabilis TaxID=68270 RepID=A0A5P2X8X9_STRST|nr:hypothetical protein [Streptomyces spectabilis]MBB5108124.1 hypothetical protein [Streptomyces spectabilis]MCI3904347.1 hypothetical protein [Streptomyces spectabilis]QEV61453.1 hypothetical protein CP982_24385 [Streptomyces spectabilis]GGV26668.1 hypothetical protein GCM10010245_43790 [Streptomyces spectabilis]
MSEHQPDPVPVTLDPAQLRQLASSVAAGLADYLGLPQRLPGPPAEGGEIVPGLPEPPATHTPGDQDPGPGEEIPA